MRWRHLCLVRALSAAGLLTCTILGTVALAASAEPAEPVPGPDSQTETVGILDAQRSGDLAIKLNGQGHDRVHFTLRNSSSKRLYVVLPPGLVAASVTGQIQSMGLGALTSNAGRFGTFRSVPAADAGFRSVPAQDANREDGIALPAGQTIEFTIPSVCLNYGVATPTPRDTFRLVDVDQYTPDPRVRKALRSLATLGTSHGVAQAAMWNICNNVPFPLMIAQFSKVVNTHEIAVAARFIEALDASGSGDLVDAADLMEDRLFIHVRSEGKLAADAHRLNKELTGRYILGLPIRVIDENESPAVPSPALSLTIFLTNGRVGETSGRVLVRQATGGGGWTLLGQTTFAEGSSISVLDGASLARAVDRAVGSAFVSVKPARRSVGSTTLKIENHLPFTLSRVVVKTGQSAGAPSVALEALGIGPARSGLAPIQAAGGTVERVVLNGL
jgi:hypothetical protein